MKRVTRWQLEMGVRALDFSRAHPDENPGSALAVTGLDERLRAAEGLARDQQEGQRRVHSATARKRELRQLLNETHLGHLTRIAKAAARELPELEEKFAFRRDRVPYIVYRTTAQRMAAEAVTHKELLVKYGLADTAMQGLTQSLADLDAAMQEGVEGRLAHVAATAKLDALAGEVVELVQGMDGLNRFRFRDQPDMLAAWKSASAVVEVSPSKFPDAPAADAGEVKPAA
jgi:hypothetical protein